MSIGKAFAESGMFLDVKSAAQAVVKITAGAEMGIPPFASMSGIHIIQGKPTIGAGLLAARVKASGKYTYQVVELTEKLCSIDFYEGGTAIGNSTFTIEEAKKAGTKNLDKFPKNMLFARALSNGVKWFTPDLFAGPVYVPEEMPDPVVVETIAEDLTGYITDAMTSLDRCSTTADLAAWKASVHPESLKDPMVKAKATLLHSKFKREVASE